MMLSQEKISEKKEQASLTIDEQNSYLRYLLHLLVDDYAISRPSFAHKLDWGTNYLSDFYAGRRQLGVNNLEILEAGITELYGPILKDELDRSLSEKRFIIQRFNKQIA